MQVVSLRINSSSTLAEIQRQSQQPKGGTRRKKQGKRQAIDSRHVSHYYNEGTKSNNDHHQAF